MAHTTPDIQILVGVLGGGSISGESGVLIKKQIETIIDSCSKSPKSKLRLNINEAHFNSRLTNVIGHATHKISPLKITVNAGYLQDQIRRSLQNMPPVSIPCNCRGNNSEPDNNNNNNNNNRGGNLATLTRRTVVAHRQLLKADDGSAKQAELELQYQRLRDERNALRQEQAIISGRTERELQTEANSTLQVMNAVQQLRLAEAEREDQLNRTSLTAQTSYDKVADSVDKYYKKNSDAIAKNPELFDSLTRLHDQLLNGTFQGTAKEANAEFLEIRREIERTGADVLTLGQKITKTFREKFYFAVMAAAAEAARGSISQLYTNVVALDDAMAQMKIVTGASTQALKEYSAGAAEAAKQTGRTMTEIMASSTEYARLGYNLEEALALSETTAKLSNVADIDTAEATSAMTAILKGFRLEAKDAELVGDMMTKVANEYAIDAGELGAALERGGASLAAANNSLAESMALMAAGNAAIQNAETVGKQHCPAA